MRKSFNLFVIILTFFCLISAVSATEKINVESGSLEEINFEIKNNNPVGLRYTIYSFGWHPWILFSYSQVFLQPGESKDIKVFLIPNKFVENGVYKIILVAESGVDRLTKELEITVSGGIENLEETKKPDVKKFLFDGKKITLIVDSDKELDLKISVYKEDNLLTETEKKIYKGENKIIKFFDLDVGTYLAKIDFYKDKDLVYSANKSYSVKWTTKKENIVETKEEWDYWFISGARIIFENKGEKTEKKEYSVYVGKSVDSFFDSKNYKEKVDEGDRYKYLWEFVLLPNQKYTIIYSYNYSVILILSLTVIFFAFLFYFSNKKEIKVKKFFTNKVHGIKEEKEIRICLEVINKTREDLDKIILEDFVPPIFKLEKEFHGVKPDKIMKIGSEEKLVWEIPKLGPRETRIFTYKIIPKIGLSERYSFSLARVKYKKDQISKVLFSNSLVTRGD